MQPIKAYESSGICHEMPPVITPIFKSTPNLKTPPLCQSCQLACSKCHVPKVNQPTKAQQDLEGVLSWDAYEAGNFVSADQYVVNTPGRLVSGYGWEAPHKKFHGWTLFHDAATGLIWAESQFSCGAGETLMAKEHFEQWLWELAATKIHHLHSKNGILNAELVWKNTRTSSKIGHFLELVLKWKNIVTFYLTNFYYKMQWKNYSVL